MEWLVVYGGLDQTLWIRSQSHHISTRGEYLALAIVFFALYYYLSTTTASLTCGLMYLVAAVVVVVQPLTLKLCAVFLSVAVLINVVKIVGIKLISHSLEGENGFANPHRYVYYYYLWHSCSVEDRTRLCHCCGGLQQY